MDAELHHYLSELQATITTLRAALRVLQADRHHTHQEAVTMRAQIARTQHELARLILGPTGPSNSGSRAA
jgi:hypothetical protein